jgi:hypothetical protein
VTFATLGDALLPATKRKTDVAPHRYRKQRAVYWPLKKEPTPVQLTPTGACSTCQARCGFVEGRCLYCGSAPR